MKKHIWNELSANEQQKILDRPKLLSKNNINELVQDIINQVKLNGDKALLEFTEKFDHVTLKNIKISHEELKSARQKISPKALEAINFARQKIEDYHRKQLPVSSQILQDQEGISCQRQARPIERVGLYIPGGSAPLVSTVMMLAIPAQLAGCSLKVLCTPANKEGLIDPHILVAAELCGIEQIFNVGGAQAIAAMAYGTETIPKVDKIFGPGNSWVTQAKMVVSQTAEGAHIDMPAGPSELLVIADDTANPAYVAADLLSQAEHGPDSQVILVALNERVLKEVTEEITQQLSQLSRKNIAEQSLAHCRLIVVDNVEDALAINNLYAPEHLSLQIVNAELYVSQVKNAGAIFLGNYTPETMGDYVNGSNHVLPTGGYARSMSGLSVLDFMKFISIQRVSPDGLKFAGKYAETLAEIEGLTAHGRAVSIRLSDLTKTSDE